MSKLEDGQIELSREIVDLNKLAKDIITIVEQRASDSGVNLKYDKVAKSYVSICIRKSSAFTPVISKYIR